MFNTFKSVFQKIQSALSKTSALLGNRLRALFTQPFNPDLLEKIEQTLYEADLGSSSIEKLIQGLNDFYLKNPKASVDSLIECVKNGCRQILTQAPLFSFPSDDRPYVVLVIGVNGSGKTTTCAKLAYALKTKGFTTILGGADTFRAAATEQLMTWAKRIEVPIITAEKTRDPASVVYETIQQAKNQNIEIALIDTAGRLESKTHLMQELAKIHRIAKKFNEKAPHATFLVLDATIGQTALDQIKVFHTYTPIDGIILTKMDGTAKGGVILSIIEQFKIPVVYIGTGEGLEDFHEFDPKAYLDGIL